MTVYLAAPFEHLETMKALRWCLEQEGFTVNASWLSETKAENDAVLASKPSVSAGTDYALRDLEDIDAADVIVVYNPVAFYKHGTGGRHVELGYALGKNKLIILYGGKPSNVFHHLVPVADTLKDLTAMLHRMETVNVLG